MTLPSFLIDTRSTEQSEADSLWLQISGRPAWIAATDIGITHQRADDGSECILVGYAILNDRIANEAVTRLLAEKIDDDHWLASLDGEFLLLHATTDRLTVVSSRYGYQPFWYSHLDGRLVGGTLFADVWNRLKQLGRTGINLQSVFETLVYKRVFGTKTPHPDIHVLPPARRMTVDQRGLHMTAYWQPDFSEKLSLSLDDAADEFSARIQTALRRKTSDGRRYALFLSGGMDTRVILAHAAAMGMDLPCVTINAFENREVRVARRAAGLAGQKHIFVETPPGHYQQTLDEAVALNGAMSMPMCMFHGHRETISAFADVGLHGHGFDYFFQGMYIPAKRYAVLGRTTPFRTQRQIVGNVADDFLATVSYKLKGEVLSTIARPDAYTTHLDALREELRTMATEVSGRTASAVDVYEWLAFHNLVRHYSTGDHWGINTVVEQRTVSFDRDLYDFYQSLPTSLRFDGRIMRRSLQRNHPGLAALISANHGYPIALSSAERTLRAAVKFVQRRLLPNLTAEADEFDRMGLPQQHLIQSEWREAMYELSGSSHLDRLDFLDAGAARAFAREAADGRTLRDPQLLILLMSIDRFLRQFS